MILSGKATMFELKNCYTLDEALKLIALCDMQRDIQAQQAKERAERRD